MSEFVNEIVNGINAAESRSFLAANEYARALVFGMEESTGLFDPYKTILLSDPPNLVGAEKIREALKLHIRNNVPGDAQGVHALATFNNTEDLKFLIEMMEIQLSDCIPRNGTLGSLVCAISNFDRILSTGSYSSIDPTQFIDDAKKYLFKVKNKKV